LRDAAFLVAFFAAFLLAPRADAFLAEAFRAGAAFFVARDAFTALRDVLAAFFAVFLVAFFEAALATLRVAFLAVFFAAFFAAFFAVFFGAAFFTAFLAAAFGAAFFAALFFALRRTAFGAAAGAGAAAAVGATSDDGVVPASIVSFTSFIVPPMHKRPHSRVIGSLDAVSA
jgi:hypothetical protein